MGTNQKSEIKATSHQFWGKGSWNPSHDLRRVLAPSKRWLGMGFLNRQIIHSLAEIFVFFFTFSTSFLWRIVSCISPQEDFQQQCVRWEDDFRLAAIRATHFNCPNTRCILAVGRGKLAYEKNMFATPPVDPKWYEKAQVGVCSCCILGGSSPLSSRWLITVVSPLNRVVPLPNGLSMTYKWGLLTTY